MKRRLFFALFFLLFIFYVQFFDITKIFANKNSVVISAVVLEHITYQKTDTSILVTTNCNYPIFFNSQGENFITQKQLKATSSTPFTLTVSF